eukprot:jgi/Mesvir1/8222/Mv12510-RA.2
MKILVAEEVKREATTKSLSVNGIEMADVSISPGATGMVTKVTTQKVVERALDIAEASMKPHKRTAPKIFFATRTHGQIAHVIRELRRTPFRPTMAILASREHYCINRKVARSANRDAECKALLSKGAHGCAYDRSHALERHISMQPRGVNVVHDIEDLVKLGKQVHGCPYFGSRSLADNADIIFCPYNYLMDPVIAKAMKVNVADAVVIFDEAHNIEDVARSAASVEVNVVALKELKADLLSHVMVGLHADVYNPLLTCTQGLLALIDQKQDSLRKTGFERFCGIFQGDTALQLLKGAGITTENGLLKHLINCLVRAGQISSESDAQQSLTGRSLSTLEGLFTILDFMLGDDGQNLQSYRLAILKYSKWNDSTRSSLMTVDLCLWCLNPAVAFTKVASKARSVILTSGTLSPMCSFASELGTEFKVRLEANHVIEKEQVWAGALAMGPDNVPMSATYKDAESLEFQDSFGEAMLQFVKVVPGGLLLFFPSYRLLEKVSQRWKTSGMWHRINTIKKIFTEPRGSGALDDMLKDYYACIQGGAADAEEGASSATNKCTGAVMMAVCRGKISEGLDFADANARAVVVVGIPYPNIKDEQVAQKMEFNNRGSLTRGLLNGDRWYRLQAYRAINQAIGRCIRHRNDWGSIILLDGRLTKESETASLSKWIRGSIMPYHNFEQSMESLTAFFQRAKTFGSSSSESPPAPSEALPPPETAPTAAAAAPVPGDGRFKSTSGDCPPLTPLSDFFPMFSAAKQKQLKKQQQDKQLQPLQPLQAQASVRPSHPSEEPAQPAHGPQQQAQGPQLQQPQQPCQPQQRQKWQPLQPLHLQEQHLQALPPAPSPPQQPQLQQQQQQPLHLQNQRQQSLHAPPLPPSPQQQQQPQQWQHQQPLPQPLPPWPHDHQHPQQPQQAMLQPAQQEQQQAAVLGTAHGHAGGDPSVPRLVAASVVAHDARQHPMDTKEDVTTLLITLEALPSGTFDTSPALGMPFEPTGRPLTVASVVVPENQGCSPRQHPAAMPSPQRYGQNLTGVLRSWQPSTQQQPQQQPPTPLPLAQPVQGPPQPDHQWVKQHSTPSQQHIQQPLPPHAGSDSGKSHGGPPLWRPTDRQLDASSDAQPRSLDFDACRPAPPLFDDRPTPIIASNPLASAAVESSAATMPSASRHTPQPSLAGKRCHALCAHCGSQLTTAAILMPPEAEQGDRGGGDAHSGRASLRAASSDAVSDDAYGESADHLVGGLTTETSLLRRLLQENEASTGGEGLGDVAGGKPALDKVRVLNLSRRDVCLLDLQLSGGASGQGPTAGIAVVSNINNASSAGVGGSCARGSMGMSAGLQQRLASATPTSPALASSAPPTLFESGCLCMPLRCPTCEADGGLTWVGVFVAATDKAHQRLCERVLMLRDCVILLPVPGSSKPTGIKEEEDSRPPVSEVVSSVGRGAVGVTEALVMGTGADVTSGQGGDSEQVEDSQEPLQQPSMQQRPGQQAGSGAGQGIFVTVKLEDVSNVCDKLDGMSWQAVVAEGGGQACNGRHQADDMVHAQAAQVKSETAVTGDRDVGGAINTGECEAKKCEGGTAHALHPDGGLPAPISIVMDSEDGMYTPLSSRYTTSVPAGSDMRCSSSKKKPLAVSSKPRVVLCAGAQQTQAQSNPIKSSSSLPVVVESASAMNITTEDEVNVLDVTFTKTAASEVATATSLDTEVPINVQQVVSKRGKAKGRQRDKVPLQELPVSTVKIQPGDDKKGSKPALNLVASNKRAEVIADSEENDDDLEAKATTVRKKSKLRRKS